MGRERRRILKGFERGQARMARYEAEVSEPIFPEPLPCPMCGCSPRLGIRRDGSRRGPMYGYHCSGCGIDTGMWPDRAVAAEMWNRKVSGEDVGGESGSDKVLSEQLF